MIRAGPSRSGNGDDVLAVKPADTHELVHAGSTAYDLSLSESTPRAHGGRAEPRLASTGRSLDHAPIPLGPRGPATRLPATPSLGAVSPWQLRWQLLQPACPGAAPGGYGDHRVPGASPSRGLIERWTREPAAVADGQGRRRRAGGSSRHRPAVGRLRLASLGSAGRPATALSGRGRAAVDPGPGVAKSVLTVTPSEVRLHPLDRLSRTPPRVPSS